MNHFKIYKLLLAENYQECDKLLGFPPNTVAARKREGWNNRQAIGLAEPPENSDKSRMLRGTLNETQKFVQMVLLTPFNTQRLVKK